MHNAGNMFATAADTATLRSVLLELLGDVDALAARFVTLLCEVVPYSDGAVDLPRLHVDGVNTYERVLRRLADLPVPDRLLERSRDLGRHRAHLDVPLAAVTTGTRLHFRVVWEELAERLPPEALVGAVTLPVQLWQAVEEHSADVQVGYHEAATALAYARDRDRRRIVEAFLDSDGRDEGLLARAAAVLGAGVDDDVFCAFVPARPDAGPEARAVLHGHGLHGHEWRGGTVVLAHRPRGTWPRETGAQPGAGHGRASAPAALRDVACGVGPLAHGLARVPQVVRVAERVASVLPPEVTGPTRPAEVALAVAAQSLGAIRTDVAADVLHDLLDLPAPERDRLLETFDVYCATGSVALTADRAFCHRNTVLNRLRRLTECTGLDVTVPGQCAVLLLAVTAWRSSAPD
ncbi:PucR family transcriptional regulator [Kineococcus sp. TBRC 1896]|uniref:PucR family transcriptional regulator n=1 Tax=Kineococcus mangrovi TaxID=1660183 RepID=A0ABV4IAB0_9ACTN